MHDAGIPLAELRRYQRLADKGQMPLRIYATVSYTHLDVYKNKRVD